MSTDSHRRHPHQRASHSHQAQPSPAELRRRANFRNHLVKPVAWAVLAAVATPVAMTEVPKAIGVYEQSKREGNAYSDWSLDNDQRDPKKVEDDGQGILTVVHKTFTNLSDAQEAAVAGYVEERLPKNNDGTVYVYRGQELDIPVPEDAKFANPDDANHLLPPRGHGPDPQLSDEPTN